jgi:glycosyltransferase involved in cell wall biosynthesis
MTPARVMFTYWGRRGALSQFTWEVGRAALADPTLTATISVSSANEMADRFRSFGDALFPVETFATDAGALALWRIPALRRQLRERIARDRVEAVIELLPHVWSPFVMTAIKGTGARYATIVHDADAHPGDRTGKAKALLDGALRHADTVVTLGGAVAARLRAQTGVPPERLVTLFHPDLTYGSFRTMAAPLPGEPLRLLFLGRIMPYKGLPLFVAMLEQLEAEGVKIAPGVFGEGPLGDCEPRLRRLGAEIANRWLSEAEIAETLPQYHALVLSHVEASQSGVAAAAFGAGLPVVATPVGGLVEQVREGKTGVTAAAVEPVALAAAVKRLLLDPKLYEATTSALAQRREQRSMKRFVTAIVAASLGKRQDSPA